MMGPFWGAEQVAAVYLQVDYSTAPGSSAAYTYSTAAAPPAVGYSAGMGLMIFLSEGTLWSALLIP